MDRNHNQVDSQSQDYFNGYGDAMYKLGNDCDKESQSQEMIGYYTEASSYGHADAMYKLGMYYQSNGNKNGIYIKNLPLFDRSNGNVDEMKKYFLMASEHKHDGAMLQLGLYYSDTKDYDNMKKYYLMAIDNGNVGAMNNLGAYYNDINDVPNMVKYYLMAVRQGSVDALVNLGLHCENIKNYKKMKSYFLEAIDKGSMVAMYCLGKYYQNNKDHDNMIKYYFMATENGLDCRTAINNYYKEVETETKVETETNDLDDIDDDIDDEDDKHTKEIIDAIKKYTDDNIFKIDDSDEYYIILFNIIKKYIGEDTEFFIDSLDSIVYAINKYSMDINNLNNIDNIYRELYQILARLLVNDKISSENVYLLNDPVIMKEIINVITKHTNKETKDNILNILNGKDDEDYMEDEDDEDYIEDEDDEEEDEEDDEEPINSAVYIRQMGYILGKHADYIDNMNDLMAELAKLFQNLIKNKKISVENLNFPDDPCIMVEVMDVINKYTDEETSAKILEEINKNEKPSDNEETSEDEDDYSMCIESDDENESQVDHCDICYNEHVELTRINCCGSCNKWCKKILS
jgi:TPR repeat protein